MKIISHRGAKGLAPENTLRAFEKAIAHHVDQIEFDLRVTKDNVVVLHHNRDITDPAGNKLLLHRHTLAELSAHKPDLITFDALLDAIGHRTHLLIEIKPGEPVAPIAAAIKGRLEAGWPSSIFSVGSFDQSVLRAMHHAFPSIETVVIEHWSGLRARWRARQLGTKRISMRSWWLWRGFLRAMHRRGYQITPYTLNSVARARKWSPYLYGIITDRPDLFEQQSWNNPEEKRFGRTDLPGIVKIFDLLR